MTTTERVAEKRRILAEENYRKSFRYRASQSVVEINEVLTKHFGNAWENCRDWTFVIMIILIASINI